MVLSREDGSPSIMEIVFAPGGAMGGGAEGRMIEWWEVDASRLVLWAQGGALCGYPRRQSPDRKCVHGAVGRQRQMGRYRSAVLLLACLTLSACIAAGRPIGNAPAHHVSGGFANPSGARGPDPAAFVLDRLRLAIVSGAQSRAAVLTPEQAMSGWAGTPGDGVLWLGHASLLVRLDGVILAVDPVFADRVSPITIAGPARLSPPPLDAASMPSVHAILVTHDHYDHFEPASLAALAARSAVVCVAPLAVSFSGLGCAREVQLDWGDETRIGEVGVKALPAQHESGRGAFDRNASLWVSYLLSGGTKRVYVTGDTGYGEHLKQVGMQYGPIDLLVMSLGGYEPRQANKDVHMSPEESVAAARDLRARRVLLVHWGTYPLGEEDAAEALAAFLAAAERAGIVADTVSIVPIGGLVHF